MNYQQEMFAVVTGSSRGIGRGVALALVQNGYHVAINYLKDEKAAKDVVAEAVKVRNKSIAIQADVSDIDSVKRLFAEVNQKFGRLDVLVNNVGNFMMKPLAKTNIEDWQAVIDSNLNSAFYCCKWALECMRQQGYGRIVNIAFANASQVRAYKQVAAYAIAKTGVLILTKSLAVEEAANGITVNAVSPGFIQNDSLSLETMTNVQNQIPVGTMGTPQDIANAVLYLISEKAKYVTGAEIVVSGGWGL